MDDELREFAGVDVSEVEKRDGVLRVVERWERTLMGLRSSPYVCTQAFGWSEECIRGDRLDANSPLFWDKVQLNLPGDEHYDPKKPWVYRINSETNEMASFFGTYIDDIRTGGSNEKACHATTRRVASWINYLGQQDAPRKRRFPSQTPGAWAGAICVSNEGEGLFVSCSQEKWEKGKAIVEKWHKAVVKEGSSRLNRKELERGVGFLVHLSRSFPCIMPYLKGIYLTMESWRVGRDEDGWKLSTKGWIEALAGEFEDGMKDMSLNEGKAFYKERKQGPVKEEVKVVPRLKGDLIALQDLFSSVTPPRRLVRGKAISEFIYGFGDASGAGFGASWEDRGKVQYRFGTWGKDMDNSSSNFRELKNLVDTLEEMNEKGKLRGIEVFLFTDNTTAENAFFKGTSSNEKLFNLVLDIRRLEMNGGCKVHFCHVAGTRMIDQGSDGLSRGNLSEGVMKGTSMSSFIPLNKTAFERSGSLEAWLRGWTDESVTRLEPEDWFERGHDLLRTGTTNCDGRWIPEYEAGSFIWSPAPAAAETALEELRKARHKRQDSTHVFIVPRLMEPHWRRHLYRSADVVLTLPAGHPAWPSEMHEPLIIALFYPFLSYRPWQVRKAPVIVALAEQLQRVWKTDGGSEGPVLRQLWDGPRRLANMSEVLAWKVLCSKQGFSFSDCKSGK